MYSSASISKVCEPILAMVMTHVLRVRPALQLTSGMTECLAENPALGSALMWHTASGFHPSTAVYFDSGSSAGESLLGIPTSEHLEEHLQQARCQSEPRDARK